MTIREFPLLIDSLTLPENVGRVFHTAPLSHILHEKWDKGIYTQTLAIDVDISKFFFCPVALREVETSSKQAYDEWLLKGKPDWENSPNPSPQDNILILPLLARTCKLYWEGQEVGKITEYLSSKAQFDHAYSILDYVSQKVPTEIREMIKHIKTVLDEEPKNLLALFLPELPLEQLDIILAEVEAVDHFACIAPPEVQRSILDTAMSESGFSIDHRSFTSTVLAKELEAPIKIIKAQGLNKQHKRVGIEMFIPTESPLQVDNWIQNDRGTHIAFRVSNDEAIHKIRTILEKHHIAFPDYMQGGALKNPQEKVSVLYCEVKFGYHNFRIEFCCRN